MALGDSAAASAPTPTPAPAPAAPSMRPSSSSAAASNARPPRGEEITPASERVVDQCLALLPHAAGEHPHDEMDPWLDRPGHFDPANHGANPKASGENHPDPAELALNDHDRDLAGHMRRMFIEDGDHPANGHRGDGFKHHGLHPYIAIKDEDPTTLTGACPRTTAENAALAASSGDAIGAAHHRHHDPGEGLCAPPISPSALPALTPAAAGSDFAVAGSFQAVPEPGTMGLLGVLLSMTGLGRRRH
jgi:hypothetical protein